MDPVLASVLIVVVNTIGAIALAYIKAKWPSAVVTQDQVTTNGRPDRSQGTAR